jgi:Uncharacterized protein conserved in archaea
MVKLLTIVVSQEPEKINLAIGFSKRQKDKGHEVRLLFFGPSESAIADNPELAKQVAESFPGAERPKACVFVAERANIKEKLSKMADLLPAGEFITDSIEKGYTPITF